MNRAGIHSLEELKGRLDAHGEAKMRSLGRTTKEGVLDDVMWVWINTYRYIFSGMNIHLPAILMFTRGTRF
jgi:hypothetical protein